jgi:hypothetical protein
LEARSRLARCSLDRTERDENPEGTYYIQDGNGRALPNRMLVRVVEVEAEAVVMAPEGGAG